VTTGGTRVASDSQFGGCLDGTEPTLREKIESVPAERVQDKVLEHVDSATEVKVVEKTENRVVLDVTTDKEIDDAVIEQLKVAIVDSLELGADAITDDKVHIEVEQHPVAKRALFSSTVTATIDEDTGGAFAVTGLVSILVAILAALF